jgi:L-ascorbate metabolism protein UlaG (beta-lactamase superfamily)
MPFRYANLDPAHTPHGFGDLFRWSVLERVTGARRRAAPGPPAPRVPVDLELVHRKDGVARVTWIGHASFLATLDSSSFLVDPVFSKRIAGVVPRHGQAGLDAADLPPLSALLVTHNHYDHLDEPSVRSLPRALPVYCAAGLGSWFTRRGFTNVTDMRWWDEASAGPLSIAFVPARHWSRRSLWDTNRTAWGGFVIRGGGATLYHAGDTGWFSGFRQLAERYPAIDLALLPVGAYAPAWFMEPQHMNPEQAVDALQELRARAMVPMHWGAFQLTDERLQEPIERLRCAWERARPQAELHVLSVGETISVR